MKKYIIKRIIRAIIILAAAIMILIPLIPYIGKRMGINDGGKPAETTGLTSVSSRQQERLSVYARYHGMSVEDADRLVNKSAKEINKQEETASHLLGGILIDNKHGYTKKQRKKTPSDIDGMTLQDKKEAGLIWWVDGSDSDGDGLTDKEEIEKYKSDPLKYSTSGDLYSDGYKAAHDMKMAKKYKHKGKEKYKNNLCSNVYLHSDTAYSLDHTIVSASPAGMYYLPHAEILRCYLFSGFEGTAEIDLTDDLKKADLSIRDVTLFDGNYTDQEIKDYEKEDNIVTLHIDKRIPVLVVKKDSILSDIGEAIGFHNVPVTEDMEVRNFDAFAFDFHVLNLLGAKPRIYYVSTGSKKKDKAYLDPLLEKADEMAEGYMFRQKGSILYRGKYTIDEHICRKVTQAQIDKIRNTITDLPIAVNWDEDNSWLIEYFSYTDKSYDYAKVLEEEEKEKQEEEEEEENPVPDEEPDLDDEQELPDEEPQEEPEHEEQEEEPEEDPEPEETEEDEGIYYQWNGEFRHGADDFPFTNFGSTISPGGNCAGITTYVSRIYNNYSVPENGGYHISNLDKDVTWDISKDAENATLLNMGLYDYQDEDFSWKHNTQKAVDPITKEEVDVLGDLSDGQQEFVNMIGCYWRELNDRININDYTILSGSANTQYDFSMWERAMAILDQKKILGCIMWIEDACSGSREPVGAHDVNIVGYEKLSEPGQYLFWVYDSNYNDGLQPLVVTRYDDNSFNYLYRTNQVPSGTQEYFFSTSFFDLCSKYAVILHDENYNVLN